MAKIAVLPIDVANKIAAGEIIERPVSIVKELLENSIDSKATVINVEIEHGGKSIRISDNGEGIEPDQMELAFTRFATSKLKSEEELWKIGTLGFRGEALASIAAVSNVECYSCNKEGSPGRRIIIQGGVIKNQEDFGCPKGTTIKISDLFYNTPARLKFLKSDQTENGLIEEIVTVYSIAYPEISFRLTKNGKKSLNTLGNSQILDVIRLIYDKEFSNSLFHFERPASSFKIEGYISYPTYWRNDKSRQLFFVNKRFVKIPAFNKILEDSYRGLLPDRHCPAAIIFITVEPESVDVNIHPTKKEVRFRSAHEINGFFRSTIINSLQNILTENISENTTEPLTPDIPKTEESYYKRPAMTSTPFVREYPSTQYHSPKLSPVYIKEPENVPQPQIELFEPVNESLPVKQIKDFNLIGQLWNTYIIFSNDDGIWFIDQHIAHERYLYEKLRDAKVETQNLLVTCDLKLASLDIGILKDNAGLFEEYGFTWNYMNDDSISITGVPHILTDASIEKTFLTILAEIKDEDSPSSFDAKREKLRKTISCHSAIKAGKVLIPVQMEEIIKNWQTTSQPYFCPHGRPITFRLNKNEFDAKFNR